MVSSLKPHSLTVGTSSGLQMSITSFKPEDSCILLRDFENEWKISYVSGKVEIS